MYNILDFLFSALSDLGRMYQLVSHIVEGLGKLKMLLESHICSQGLAAIEKCGDTAVNVRCLSVLHTFLNAVYLVLTNLESLSLDVTV